MKKLTVLSIIVCLLQLTFGCASPDDKSAGSSSSSSTSPPGAPIASEASPLVLKISTVVDGTSEYHALTFQETGTTSCSSTESSPVITCTVSVPEGRLYYSKVIFSYSWRNDKCKFLFFQPYYYIANKTSAAYSPPWLGDSTADCSKTDIQKNEAGCFGGAAPELVPDFPKNLSLIHLSDPSVTTPQTNELKLSSAYSKKYRSSRYAANDLPAAKQGNPYNEAQLGVLGDNYVAGSMVSYQWTCSDDWLDPKPYIIKLIITDEDTSGSGPNDVLTWKEL